MPLFGFYYRGARSRSAPTKQTFLKWVELGAVHLILSVDSSTLRAYRVPSLGAYFPQPGEGVYMTTQETSKKVNVDKELLAILCCPDTKQDVTLADDGLIASLNARIEKGEVKNKSGQPVKEKLDGGLIRADRKILYPIREDIPVMLIEEGIPVEGLA